MTVTQKERERKIYRVTLAGSIINMVLLAFKFVAGVVGGSAAMIADAVHSLSDFLTDIVVVVFVRISSKPQDSDHDYGHGKYETLATSLIGMALLAVGVMILYNGARDIMRAIGGEQLPKPGMIALVAALVSIALKEWAYQFTVRAGKQIHSSALVANAWHHRSDSLSSIGTAIGVGGAIALGSKWAVLDPIAAVVVSLFVIATAAKLLRQSADELLEKSLPQDIEREIVDIVGQEPVAGEVHNLCTRRIGSAIAIEMHVRMPGSLTLYESHIHASNIERRLRQRFGSNTHLSLHVEPMKVDGQYVDPRKKEQENEQ
ncbi:MAG: cation diffusion facilitator family transporter [Prevotella sp.]